jgi:trimeric autotransporter adhesin
MLSSTRFITVFALIAAMARIAAGSGTPEAVADVPTGDGATGGSTGVESAFTTRAPGGSNGSVQFNSRGRFGGDAANFFWSATFKRLGIGTQTPNEQLEITGNLRLPVSTADAGVIMSGANPFIHNFGKDNTFIGVDAGNFSMSGDGNTGTGVNALASNTKGICNTAIGGQTLKANTEGDNNTAIGHFALSANGIGTDNTASGVLALFKNTTGSRNTASGDNALVNNDVGHDNTADGVFALGANTDGYWNTASGAQALLGNTHGAANTASGYNALTNNTEGNDNVAIGWFALDANTIGFNNTGIGDHATVSRSDLHNATAIGALAVVDDSNKIRLGDDAVSVIEGRVPYTWTSDKNQKENFRPVDGEDVLMKIRGLNLRSWNYIGDDPQRFRHYGPVAQEFYAAFGHDAVGTSGTPTTINSGDATGILMMAVQALERRTAEVEAMKVQIAELRALIRAQGNQPK